MADVADLRREVADWTAEVATKALDDLLDATLDAAPERTGATKALTHVDGPFMVADFVAQGTIACDAPYAEWTDKGSDEHVIEGNPLLAFYWEKLGRNMVLPRVTIPAQPGTQWFNSGIEDGEPMASRWATACENAASA